MSVPTHHQDVDPTEIVQVCTNYAWLPRQVVHFKRFSIKFGHCVTREEAENQNLASTILVPGSVPRVYCYFSEQETKYLVMERVYGRAAETQDIPAIARLIASLHTFSNDQPGPVGGGRCSSLLLPEDEVFPCESKDELERHIQSRCIETQFDIKDTPLVFVHGDLRLSNILLGPESICLLDWEFAGFYPRSVEIATLSLSYAETHEDMVFRQHLKQQIILEHHFSQQEICQADSLLEFAFNSIRYSWYVRHFARGIGINEAKASKVNQTEEKATTSVRTVREKIISVVARGPKISRQQKVPWDMIVVRVRRANTPGGMHSLVQPENMLVEACCRYCNVDIVVLR